MTHVWKQTILVLLVGFSIVMLPGYASAQSPADVTGTWTGGTTTGAATLVLVLKQDGQKVTGTTREAEQTMGQSLASSLETPSGCGMTMAGR
jgi:hypothetical protein